MVKTAQGKKTGTLDLIKSYLATKKCLIVDKSGTLRSNFRKLLTTFGMNSDLIFFAENFAEASKIMTEQSTNFVIAEFNLGKQSGLKLLRKHKEIFPNRMEGGLYIVVENLTPGLHAKILESEAEGFFVRPFTLEELQKNFLKTIAHKLAPNSDVIAYEEANALLNKRKTGAAEKILEELKDSETTIPDVYYHLGKIYQKAEDFEGAEELYQEGLLISQHHFGIYNQLLELQLMKKDYKKAFEISKELAKAFFIPPLRLPSYIKLSLKFKAYEEMKKYWEIYNSLDANEVDREIQDYMAAGLAVSGKHFINLDANQAKDYFIKAAQLVNGDEQLAETIIEPVLSHRMTKAANDILANWTEEGLLSKDFLDLIDLQIKSFSTRPEELLAMASSFYQKGYRKEVIYEILIRGQRHIGKDPKIIEEYVEEAIKKYPSKEKHFKNLPN